jgi:hypothetical protein
VADVVGRGPRISERPEELLAVERLPESGGPIADGAEVADELRSGEGLDDRRRIHERA